MKAIAVFTLAALLLVIGCQPSRKDDQTNHLSITGSGKIVAQELDLADFDQIEAGLHFDLVIRQGEDFEVIVKADDNMIDFIDAQKVGRTLTFGLKPGFAYNLYGTTMRTEVTMPRLAGLRLNGSSRASLKGLHALEPLEAELTGSSLLTGQLEAEWLGLNVNGGAGIDLQGSAQELRLDACGNSVSNLSRFFVAEAVLDVSCASTALVRVTDLLNVEASQHSRVHYFDRPEAGELNAYESSYIGPALTSTANR